MGYTIQPASDLVETRRLYTQYGKDQNRPFIGDVLKYRARFAHEGATTWFTSRREEELQNAAAKIEGNALPLRADVSQRSELARIMENIQQLDVLVINAGMSEYATLEQVSETHFENTFGLNVRSPLFALQAALPLLEPGASVVLIGSVADVIGTEGYGVYGASRAAMRALFRVFRRFKPP
ncbi:MAG: oxidoreductase [Proteobacteria bacterium]|nr:oxidoreductase [Pseudomonadota bacterium]